MVNLFELDAAVLGKLLADPQLMAVCPDGVYFGPARAGAQKFVTVSRIEHVPEFGFGVTAWDVVLYQAKAVILSTSALDIKTAAGRIHAVLQDATNLAPAGYRVMEILVKQSIRYVEVDGVNADLRWQHGGGQYEVHAIPTA